MVEELVLVDEKRSPVLSIPKDDHDIPNDHTEGIRKRLPARVVLYCIMAT